MSTSSLKRKKTDPSTADDPLIPANLPAELFSFLKRRKRSGRGQIDPSLLMFLDTCYWVLDTLDKKSDKLQLTEDNAKCNLKDAHDRKELASQQVKAAEKDAEQAMLDMCEALDKQKQIAEQSKEISKSIEEVLYLVRTVAAGSDDRDDREEDLQIQTVLNNISAYRAAVSTRIGDLREEELVVDAVDDDGAPLPAPSPAPLDSPAPAPAHLPFDDS